MNKVELNKEIGKLKASLEAHESQVKDLQHDLKTAEQRLTDADKPKLTEKQFSAIQSVIENTVENYSFDDADRYEFELGIEYDNKIYLSHINFDGQGDLADDIYQGVEDLFGIADESDDTETVPSE
tara:strand:- start:15 stop:392 length:378 start_codon:yes stop_codon:yes gene_type:complete